MGGTLENNLHVTLPSFREYPRSEDWLEAASHLLDRYQAHGWRFRGGVGASEDYVVVLLEEEGTDLE